MDSQVTNKMVCEALKDKSLILCVIIWNPVNCSNGVYVYVVFSHGMDPSNICSIVYYIRYEKEENIERRMVFGALVYCIWGVFGVFDRVFLFV